MGGATNPEQFMEDLFEMISGIKDLFYILVLSIFKRMWLETAFYLLDGAIPDENDEYLDELRDFTAAVRKTKKNSRNIGVAGTLGVSAIVVIPVFLMIAYSITLVVNFLSGLGIGLIEMFLVLVIMRISKYIVAFSYIWFGTLDFDAYITTDGRSIG